MIDIPQIALPARFDGGRLAVVEQGSDDHLVQRVETVLRYEPGDMESNPAFGRHDLAFRRGGPTDDMIIDAVDRWVPEAALAVDIDLSPLDPLVAEIRVGVVSEGR